MLTYQDEGTHAASVHVMRCYDCASCHANMPTAPRRPPTFMPLEPLTSGLMITDHHPRLATQSTGTSGVTIAKGDMGADIAGCGGNKTSSSNREAYSGGAASKSTKRKNRCWNKPPQPRRRNEQRLSPPPPPPGVSHIPDPQSINAAPRAKHLATPRPLVAEHTRRRPWRTVDGIRAHCAGPASSQAEDRISHPTM